MFRFPIREDPFIDEPRIDDGFDDGIGGGGFYHLPKTYLFYWYGLSCEQPPYPDQFYGTDPTTTVRSTRRSQSSREWLDCACIH